MATKKKMLQAAAGQAGGAGLDITDVFSTYLYSAAGVAQTITNGIDLDGEGGLVWIKNRTGTDRHGWYDTARGVYQEISSDLTNAQRQVTQTLTAFNSDGFDVGTDSTVGDNGRDYTSWTFRKAPKFFDVVTYTGDGTQNRQVSHNLGVAPGVIIVKSTSVSGYNWNVYHRSLPDDNASWVQNVFLNTTDAAGGYGKFSVHANQTDSVIQFYDNNASSCNASGANYVAYLFAHNDGDGEFGPDGDADIIKCGSFTTDGSGLGSVTLGFEPQWLMVKNADNIGSWVMMDTMRGMSNTGSKGLFANLSNAESNYTSANLVPTATGFDLVSNLFNANDNLIYIAIRRGPLAPPESGTEVFAASPRVIAYPTYTSGFPVDFALTKRRVNSNDWNVGTRMLGATSLSANTTSAEVSLAINTFDYMNGWNDDAFSDEFSWMFRRAPNFFDVVAYTGDGVAGRTVSHNLGVAPEMMWVKRRNDTASWRVYHSGLNVDGDNAPETDFLALNDTNAAADLYTIWNDTAPNDSVFTVGGNSGVNTSGSTYIAYLFATLAGVSKVGSYTGNGTSQTIDCGFTSGARFILVKRTDSTGDWYVWDTERGIVAGNDPYLVLNTQGSEVTSTDWVDPDSSGFIVNGTTINASSAEYIFYAIA